MGYSAIGMFILFIIIFIIIWYVAELCSILGIVFGCISCSNSKKYVNTRGLGNFKSIRNYHTAATVFMVISCVVVALWIALCIWFNVEAQQYDGDYSEIQTAAEFFGSSIPLLAIHIGSIVAGIVAQVKYKSAKELNGDIVSGRVAPPPPPVVPIMVYPANPYQQNGYYQNGYYGQPNNPYQQGGYYNQQNNPQNPYRQQNGYNGQYNNQQYPQQQNQYNRPPQGYQQQPQNSTFTNGQTGINQQTGTQSPFPDPTVPAAPADSAAQNSSQTAENAQNESIAASKTVTCPACGTEVTSDSKFCINCGNLMK